VTCADGHDFLLIVNRKTTQVTDFAEEKETEVEETTLQEVRASFMLSSNFSNPIQCVVDPRRRVPSHHWGRSRHKPNSRNSNESELLISKVIGGAKCSTPA
jgi:hypothetical protein